MGHSMPCHPPYFDVTIHFPLTTAPVRFFISTTPSVRKPNVAVDHRPFPPHASLAFYLLHFRRVVSHTFLPFPLTLSASGDDYRKLRVSAETNLLSFLSFVLFHVAVSYCLVLILIFPGSIFSLFFFFLSSYHLFILLFSTLCINTKILILLCSTDTIFIATLYTSSSASAHNADEAAAIVCVLVLRLRPTTTVTLALH
jgi:hypothetical protein